jgi:DNA anti-recombination protein RmuC
VADFVFIIGALFVLAVVGLLVAILLLLLRRPVSTFSPEMTDRLATLQMLPALKQTADQRLPAIEKTTDTLSQLLVASTQARLQEEKTVRETLKVLHESTKHTPALATKVAVLENEFKRLQTVEVGVRELQNLFLSTQGRGHMGEEAVRNVFQHLPHDMWEEQRTIAGGRVDFVIHLPNKRILPIDSKTSGLSSVTEYYALGEKIALATTDEDRQRLLADQGKLQTKVRSQVLAKSSECASYIQPENGTLGIAIQAVPDALFAILDVKTRKSAADQNVQIVPYGLLLPIIHVLRSQNQYDRLDFQGVVAAMQGIRLQSDIVRDVLANKFDKAQKFLKSGIDDVQGALDAIEKNTQSVEGSGVTVEVNGAREIEKRARARLRQAGLVESAP